MEMQEFLDQLEQTIFRYDLLQHPFYQAWSRGELALEDLREYARDYYHQVESFPGYLLRFAARLERGDPRAAVLANLRDEVGGSTRRSHSDLWLDFVEGMGAERPLAGHKPSSQIFDLVLFFEQMAKQGSREEVLAASMPTNRKCRECRGKNGEDLLRNTGASERTCGYFVLHTTADVYDSRVWLRPARKTSPGSSRKKLRGAQGRRSRGSRSLASTRWDRSSILRETQAGRPFRYTRRKQ